MDKPSYVYILASSCHGNLYIGVTCDLIRRAWQHREGFADSFTKKHGIKHLVWYETYCDIHEAIAREKQLKKWNRAWKFNLIQGVNPDWRDLYDDLVD